MREVTPPYFLNSQPGKDAKHDGSRRLQGITEGQVTLGPQGAGLPQRCRYRASRCGWGAVHCHGQGLRSVPRSDGQLSVNRRRAPHRLGPGHAAGGDRRPGHRSPRLRQTPEDGLGGRTEHQAASRRGTSHGPGRSSASIPAIGGGLHPSPGGGWTSRVGTRWPRCEGARTRAR
jgi:hypothetical protein